MPQDVEEDTLQDSYRTPSSNRVSVYQAAEILGVTVDAIRKRTQRGTIPHERDEDGRVWVLLDATSKVQDAGQDTYQTPGGTPTDRGRDGFAGLADLREQVAYLREQLDREREARTEERRRQDTIIAQLTQANAALAQRVPELEAPQRPEDASEGVEARSNTEGPHVAQERPFTNEEPPRRSWWREFFGFE